MTMHKATGLHTFHVNAQKPVSSQNLPTPSAKPTFHTISPNSFREEVTKVKSNVRISGHPNPQPQTRYGDAIRFANPKTTHGFTHRQEKNLLPPKKRLRTSKYPKDPTVATLSGRKPVNTALPTDAWALVLASCDLRFLIGARLVCRAFHEILSKESIWREVRERTFPYHPSCPPGLSEMQYANLIADRGCQIRPCTRGNTRKVYWAFMLRMCEQCYHLSIQPIEDTGVEATTYNSMYDSLTDDEKAGLPMTLAQLLPCASTDSGRYIGVHGSWNGRSRPPMGHGKYYVFSNSYLKLKLEFAEARMTNGFDFLAWIRRKWDVTCRILETASILEDRHDYLASISTSHVDLRFEKARYFIGQAAELDPPMSERILEKMVAYHGAVETNNKVSLRSWDVLKSKIDRLDLREQAERLLMWDEFAREPFEFRQTTKVWDRVKARREARYDQPRRYTEEQEVVVQIARQQFQDLVDTVHDENLLLSWLDAVRRTYENLEEKPTSLNGDGTEGTYWLTMDDARMIVVDILETSQLRNTMRERTIFNSLKCIACWRPDYNKTFGFEELIRHVRKIHCKYVGVDLHFHRIAAPLKVLPVTTISILDPVPWYHIPWPKSFPAVPGHCKVESRMTWNPDEEVVYVRHPDEFGSAFEDRVASNESIVESSDLSASFCEAMRVLEGTRLEASATIKIALTYASQRAANECDNSLQAASTLLSVREFQRLEETMHEISPSLTFKYLCRACMKASSSDCHLRYIRYPTALHKLVVHCEDKHDIELDAPIQDVLHLPSNSELRQILEEEEAKLKQEKDRLIAKARDGIQRLDPRVQALLEIPSCMDRFTQLFPLRSVSQGKISSHLDAE